MEATLLSLPSDAIIAVLRALLPHHLTSPGYLWRPALSHVAACRGLLRLLPECLSQGFPSLASFDASRPSVWWLQLIAAVQGQGTTHWIRLRTLRQPERALPPGRKCPKTTPPVGLGFGVSLCAMPTKSHDGVSLVLFGGCSSAGEKRGSTHLARVSWFPAPLAQWDEVHPLSDWEPRPAARAYHTAARAATGMLVFGGVSGRHHLLNDCWLLELDEVGVLTDDEAPAARWRELLPEPCSPRPCGRSSHVMVPWGERRMVLHGGRGARGTLADCWVLEEESWRRLHTCGAHVALERHCGGVLGE